MAAAIDTTDQIIIEGPGAAVAVLEQRTDPLVIQAQHFRIDRDDLYQKAADFLRDVKAMQKDVEDTLRAPIADANRAHKSMTALRSKLLAPLKDAENTVKRKMAAFVEAQEKIAREERRRIEAEARKAEEERRLREAERLEAEGDDQAAEEVISAPIVVPSVPKAAPVKAEGVSTRKIYRAKVVDLEALVRAASAGTIPAGLVVANQSALDSLAKSLKESFRIPGVELDVETSIASQAR